MKKILSLFIVSMMIISLALTGCSKGSADPGTEPADAEKKVYKITAAYLPPENSPIVQSIKYFKELVEKESNGQITVEIFHSRQLGGSDRELAEKCSQNIIQMTAAPTYTMAEFSGIQEYSVTEIPYMFKEEKDFNKLVDSELFAELNKKLTEKTGLLVHQGWLNGWMAISTTKKSVVLPSDIKGLKIRSQSNDVQLKTLEAFGAAPVPMGVGELFTALPQGTVDGFVGINQMVVDDKFYEFAKYIVDVNPFSTYYLCLINKQFYDSLPADLQAVMDKCLDQLITKARDTISQQIEKNYETLTNEGMTVHRLTADEKQKWVEACKQVTENTKTTLGADFVSKVEELLSK